MTAVDKNGGLESVIEAAQVAVPTCTLLVGVVGVDELLLW